MNDIQFSINEDVQFKLQTEDNYEGRDIDVGIVMPGDVPKIPAPTVRDMYSTPAPPGTMSTRDYGTGAPGAQRSPLMAAYQQPTQ